MGLDLKVLYYPKTNEYEVVSSDGYRLILSEQEYNIIRKTMNGIALALAEKARERRKVQVSLPATTAQTSLVTYGSSGGQQLLSADPIA